ncbi:MAG: HNH endonuclease [Candidatus Hydrogenedentes bacterium]|nr:HNH endonuclease [Candidatus Hydrogenedentota bacterium]
MLDGHVLVLNKSWVAINVAPTRRALRLLYQGHARVVHPLEYTVFDFEEWCAVSDPAVEESYAFQYISTPNFAIRLPEVIVLSAFNGYVHNTLRFSRRNLLTRDQHKCQYCGCPLSGKNLTIDHVMPRSRGGQDTWENVVLACSSCNVRKGNRTPEEAKMKLLRKPGAPRWLPSFGMPILQEDLTTWRRFMDTGYCQAS